MSRPRKTDVVRDASGRSRGEPPHFVRAVALAQRARHVGAEHADNPLASHALGRLRLRFQTHGPQDPCSISPEQYDAGERYAAIASQHAAIMGYATGIPQSAPLEVAASGMACREEPDDDEVLRVRRLFSDCYRVLMEAGRAIGQGVKVALVSYDICLDRRAMETLTAQDLGNLKVGLNALTRLFRGTRGN
jgi:hypothetical protein